MTEPDQAPIRRFLLLGDVHAHTGSLEAALRFARASGVDRVFAVGDLCDGDGDLDRTIELLGAHDVLCVRGNHDRWLLEARLRQLPFAHLRESLRHETLAFLRSLPATRAIETGSGVALLCHAVGAEDMPIIRPDTPARDVFAMDAFSAVCAVDRIALMLCGHTHARMVRTVGPVTIVNAGLLADGFVVVDTDARVVEAFDLEDGLEVRRAGTSRYGLAGQDVWDVGF